MKILHVVRHLHKLSGVSVYCSELCEVLKQQGQCVDVAVDDLSDTNQILSLKGVARLALKDVMSKTLRYDIVHIHNLWTGGLHRAARWARLQNIPIVWSLHGTLSPWAFKYKRWKKILPWHLYQKRDLLNAAILHVTSDEERKWVQNSGFGNRRIVAIPMGTTVRPEVCRAHAIHRLLFVGRIAPVKSLEKLITAWASTGPGCWRLRVVGVEDFPGYTNSLKALCVKLGASQSVDFVGPKFGVDLEKEYEDADALALVSETENFGAVVADALAWGIPVITSKGTPWSCVQSNNPKSQQSKKSCGWWVANDPDSLANVLKELVSLTEVERQAMGSRGRALVRAKFSWSAVAHQMKEVYESVIRR